MVHLQCSPEWFCNINLVLHAFFVLIALGLSYAYFRVWRLTKRKDLLYFCLGFLTINLAYITKVIIDLFTIPGFIIHLDIYEMLEIFNFLYIIYMASIFFGYFLFALAHHCTEDKDIFVLITVLLGLLLYHCLDSPLLFNVTAVALISFVVLHALRAYVTKHNSNSALVAAAFGSIALSHVFFITNIVGLTEGMAMLIGYSFQLLGFMLFLIMLVRIYYGRAKKPR